MRAEGAEERDRHVRFAQGDDFGRQRARARDLFLPLQQDPRAIDDPVHADARRDEQPCRADLGDGQRPEHAVERFGGDAFDEAVVGDDTDPLMQRPEQQRQDDQQRRYDEQQPVERRLLVFVAPEDDPVGDEKEDPCVADQREDEQREK